MKKLFLFLYIILTNTTWIFSQSVNPSLGKAFVDTEVPRVDIIIDEDHLAKILSTPNSNAEFPAAFIYTTSSSIDTVAEVGFRLRGNTSRNADKKSFKVSFNTFVRGQEWLGLEKMNLNKLSSYTFLLLCLNIYFLSLHYHYILLCQALLKTALLITILFQVEILHVVIKLTTLK